VQVVLVVLVLSNLVLTIYLAYKIHEYTESVDRHSRLSKILYDDTLDKVSKQIKAIPKEITIKNVLSIP
jgi:hypothetical protein